MIISNISSNILQTYPLHNSYVSYRYDELPKVFYFKIRYTKVKRGKETSVELPMAFIKVDDSVDLKVLLPKCNYVEGLDHDLKIGHNTRFYLYDKKVILSNPRKIKYINYIVCDIESV